MFFFMFKEFWKGWKGPRNAGAKFDYFEEVIEGLKLKKSNKAAKEGRML